MWQFRSELLGWFIGLMLALLVTLAALLHWVLAPVRRLEREIHEVEDGRSETLGGGYPRELSGVAGNLNALLVGERKRVGRYRDTLGNLAHSLKTPLAVMRSSLPRGARADTLAGEIDRMSGIIEHQLKRAAASGGALLGQRRSRSHRWPASCAWRCCKVYARQGSVRSSSSSRRVRGFIGDRGDLTELLGNLLDNACKWCRSRVRLSAASDASRRGARAPAARPSRMTGRGSPRPTARACSSAACARMRKSPGTAWGWPWCATPSSSTAARSRSTPRRSAGRASSCGFPAR